MDLEIALGQGSEDEGDGALLQTGQDVFGPLQRGQELGVVDGVDIEDPYDCVEGLLEFRPGETG